MSDRNGDKSKQPPECEINSPKAGINCPHIKETGGGMRGERYECERCGERFFLDYDDMR